MASSAIALEVYRADALVREVVFDRPIVNIGKSSSSNLCVADPNVSRRHAVIERLADDRWRVTDLGSTNGTTVNGDLVDQALLRDGDRIRVGRTTLVVHVRAVEPSRRASGVRDLSEAPALPGPGDAPRVDHVASHALLDQVAAAPAGHPMRLEVALVWEDTVLAVESFARPQRIRVGEDRDARFPVPSAALGGDMGYDLVVPHAGGFALNLAHPALSGDVLANDSVTALDSLRQASVASGAARLSPIDRPLRARLRLGEFTVLVSYGALPARPRGAQVSPDTMNAWMTTAVSAIVHLGFLITVITLPPDMAMGMRDPRAVSERAMALSYVEEIDQDEVTVREPPPDDDVPRIPSDRSPHNRGPVRVTPAPDAPIERSAWVDKLNRRRAAERRRFEAMSPEARRLQADEQVQMTAMAQALGDESQLMAELLNLDPELRRTPFKALGLHLDPGAAGGPGTLGIDVFGGSFGDPGGLQPAAPTGPGGPQGPGGPVVPGIFARPPATPTDWGPVSNPEGEPTVFGGGGKVRGGLTEAIVRSHIRRQLGGIKWCYQDRLQAVRGLAGKVTLAFTILPNGTVVEPRTPASTLGDAVLEQCIRTKVSRFRFPKPEDGGLVEVSYRLVLKTPSLEPR